MTNVQPGDLARIVGCTASPESNGAIVLVIEEKGVYPRCGIVWKCQMITGCRATLTRFVDGQMARGPGYVNPGEMVCAADRILKKIEPLVEPVEQETVLRDEIPA